MQTCFEDQEVVLLSNKHLACFWLKTSVVKYKEELLCLWNLRLTQTIHCFFEAAEGMWLSSHQEGVDSRFFPPVKSAELITRWNWDSSVDAVTELRAGRLENRHSFPCRSGKNLSAPCASGPSNTPYSQPPPSSDGSPLYVMPGFVINKLIKYRAPYLYVRIAAWQK